MTWALIWLIFKIAMGVISLILLILELIGRLALKLRFLRSSMADYLKKGNGKYQC